MKNGEDQVLEAAACANCGIIDREKANRIAAIVKDKLLMITPNSSILNIMYKVVMFINLLFNACAASVRFTMLFAFAR